MQGIADFFPLPTTNDYLIGGVALLCAVVSWYIHFRFYLKVKTTPVEAEVNLPPVSVVICAHNEIDNLSQYLYLWIEQDYPTFEVIVVDDGSTDGTANWIGPLIPGTPGLKYVHLDADYIKMHGKKIALTLGFKAAKYKHFLLTDADCKPASNHWLREMAAPFAHGADVVLGVGKLSKTNGFLGGLIRYEFLQTAMSYLGYAAAGKPYMGVGRNLAYSREVYDKVGGFSSHHHIIAGDDDLFVQSVANEKNTAVVVSPGAFTYSLSKQTFREYLRQKNRHLWVGKFYKKSVKRMLSVYPVSQFLFWSAMIVWFALASSFTYPLALMLLKLVPEWVIVAGRCRILKIKKLAAFYPFWNLFYSYWYILLGIRAFFSKKPLW